MFAAAVARPILFARQLDDLARTGRDDVPRFYVAVVAYQRELDHGALSKRIKALACAISSFEVNIERARVRLRGLVSFYIPIILLPGVLERDRTSYAFLAAGEDALPRLDVGLDDLARRDHVPRVRAVVVVAVVVANSVNLTSEPTSR